MPRLRVVLYSALLTLGACSTAPDRPATLAAGDYRYVQDHIRWLAKQQMRRHDVTGLSVALVDRERVLWAEGFGDADKMNKRPATAQTRYRAGSITKLFTATAIAQLGEQGRLELDAPLTRYLPEFRMRNRFAGARAITLRDLLTHHAGLPGNVLRGMWTPEPEPWTALLPQLAEEDLVFPPGKVFGYSNLGFSLLGLVVERVSGQRYEDYVRQQILDPLAMTDAGLETGLTGPHASRGYRNGKETPVTPLRDVPAGGLNVSVLELSRFARLALNSGALDGRRLLRPDTLAEMWRVQNADVPLDFDLHMGLGWLRNRTGELDIPGAGRVLHHAGGTLLFHSQLLVLPDDGLAVVVMANSAGARAAVDKLATELARLAIEAKTGRPVAPRTPATPTHAARADEDWGGRYDTLLGYTTVRSRDGRHILSASGKDFVLKRADDGALHLRYQLLGFIPIRLPGISEFAVTRARVDDQTVLVAEQHGQRLLAGTRIEPRPIDAAWRARLGDYEFANAGRDARLIDRIELAEEDGVLVLRSSFPLFGNARVSLALAPLSDSEAVIAGLGSGRGEVLRVLPESGRLRYAGYELMRRP
jgi:CubicO group peptidase (beta-lactamase class C family)